MTVLLAERVSDLVMARLQESLPAQLAIVEADASDDIPLPEPVEYIMGERSARDYPAVWVLVADGVPELDENRSAYTGQFPHGLWTYNVEITLALTDPDDPERLRRRLYRYTRAVLEVIRQHETYDPDVSDWVRARTVGISYTRIFQHVTETWFRQDAAVLLQVSRAD